MNLIDSIAHMRGPEFLVAFGLFSLFVVVISALWARRCDPISTFALRPPDPTASSDPYEFAWLRDDARGVVATTLFELRRQHAIVVEKGVIKRTGTLASNLGPQERIVYERLLAPRKIADLLKDRSLRDALAVANAPYAAKYGSAGYATTTSERRRAVLATLVAIGLILGVAGAKVAIALSTGHSNVIFLIIIAIVVSIVLVVICRPRRLNARGRAFLKQLTTTYRPWATNATQPQADAMLPLYVGILGTSILAGTVYEDLNRELQIVRGSSGGGCASGGGCSGGGSDGGGGGCSGGGGCGGGGCGGCGGG